jgi:hypothetical protein
MLLVTAILATNAACIQSANDCNQECQAYKEAKAATSPMYLNVNATLSDFTNTPREFNQKIGTRYETDSIPGVVGQTCYHKLNAEVGCKEIIEVEEGVCSWTYRISSIRRRGY